MTESNTDQAPATASGNAPGAWEDITTRLKHKERETILAVVACGIAVLQFLIGATGGTFLTAAMLMNLALIGWLANTAFSRRRGGEGGGLLVLTAVAFVLATLSTLYLAEGVTDIVRMGQAFDNVGDFTDIDF